MGNPLLLAKRPVQVLKVATVKNVQAKGIPSSLNSRSARLAQKLHGVKWNKLSLHTFHFISNIINDLI